MAEPIPVLTIDGPSGSGKGTVSRVIAQRLGWNYLDSGAIYRALAVAIIDRDIEPTDVASIVRVAEAMDLGFEPADPPRILLSGQDIRGRVVAETTGNLASQIAVLKPVRAALLDKQRAFRKPPGLVADGRDMGTVVFADAAYKVFLTASAHVRAERRYKQLKENGIDVNLADLTQEIEERDRRDRDRSEAPLREAADAIVIDSSGLTVDQVISQCLSMFRP